MVILYNPITDVGRKGSHKVLFENSSLNSATNSNHTCFSHYTGDKRVECKINGRPEPGDFFEPKAMRGKNIYSDLSSRNSEWFNVG